MPNKLSLQLEPGFKPLGDFCDARSKNILYGNWEFDLLENKLSWSDNQYKLYGYAPRKDNLTHDFFLLKTTHFSEIERVKKIVDDALLHHETYFFRRRILKNNGEIGFAETQAKIKRDDHNRAVSIEGVTIDILGKNTGVICDYSDPEFFNYLYSNYKKTVLFHIYNMVFDRQLADDLCQEVFIKIWNNMSKFDPQKGELSTWIINIARNQCKDYIKSSYCNNKKNNVSLTTFIETNGDTELQEGISDIRRFVSLLKDDQSELIDFLYLQGYTHKEFSELKNMPIGTVKTKCRFAIKLLRRMMEEKSGTDLLK